MQKNIFAYANIRSVSQGISRPLRYPKFHCCVYITKPVVVLSYNDTFKFSFLYMQAMLILYQLVVTILYYTILYCTILCYTTLHYTILYYTILYYTILYYTILYYTIQYNTVLYYTILYYTILYYTILYYTILYYTILYYTILYYVPLGLTFTNSTFCPQSVLMFFCESENKQRLFHSTTLTDWFL